MGKSNSGSFKKGHVNTKTAFPKGMIPWNKGLHPEYLQGKNHPLYGKKHSVESKIKMSISAKKSKRMIGNKINLGRKISEETRKKLSERAKRQIHSQERREKARLIRLGHKSNLWKGGITPLGTLIRESMEWKEWRNFVLKRDNYTCQECFKFGNKLEAHHLKPFKTLFKEFLFEYNQFSPIEDKETLHRLAIKYHPFWDTNNGQILCHDCHKLTPTYGYRKEK
mgnify:CR=1 FL=1